MTWWLDEYDPQNPVVIPGSLATAKQSTFGERLGASIDATRAKADSWNVNARVEEDYYSELERDLAPYLDADAAARQRAATAAMAYGGLPRAKEFLAPRKNSILKAIDKAKAADPQKFGHLPEGDEAITQEVNTRLRAANQEAFDILANAPGGAWLAELMGEAWATQTDPAIIASTFVGGAPGRGLTGFLKFAGTEAGLGAASELAIADRKAEAADALGLPKPDLLSDVAFAGATAGLFGAGLDLIGRGVTRLTGFGAARDAGAARGRPDGVSPGQHQAAVAAAAAELAGDAVPEPVPPKTTLPPIAEDAPPNWQAIRGGIFAGESGGDYDALYGYQNRAGGDFAGTKITEMTVDQAIAFSAPGGRYANWSKRKLGKVATPMGAYQIVGTTLRAAKTGLGLRGDELMTPDLQERLGQWIYRAQGTGAWEGYAGPRADFTPSAGGGAASPGFTPTSRGYTGEGQIAVGDRRIDVEYVVVDASLLRKAEGRFQPRDRSRINSDAWISDTAARLDPAQLMPSPTADRGAPIVGPDNMIESGNGRFGAIQRAYERHPDRAAAYRQQIEAAGFTIPDGVDQPVLIARRRSELDDAAREQMTIDAQDSGVARMTPTEIAQVSARAMTAERMAAFRPEARIGDDANKGFLQSVLGALPRSERNAFFDEAGALNAEGRRRMNGAFFARAWDDGGPIGRDVLGRYAEAEDAGELKSLMDALEQAAPAWATLRAEIEAGNVRPEFDITPHVLDALSVIMQARREAGRAGGSIADAIDAILAQGDLFAGPNPLSIALLRKFWRDGRAAPPAEIARFLTRYADEARTAGRTGDMLGASPADALRAIDSKAFADLPDDIPPLAPPPARPAAVEALPPEAFAKGADSPEAEVADRQLLAELQPEPAPAKPDAVSPEIEAARAELDQQGDFELPDGTRMSSLIDQLGRDQKLVEVLDLCYGAAR